MTYVMRNAGSVVQICAAVVVSQFARLVPWVRSMRRYRGTHRAHWTASLWQWGDAPARRRARPRPEADAGAADTVMLPRLVGVANVGRPRTAGPPRWAHVDPGHAPLAVRSPFGTAVYDDGWTTTAELEVVT